MSKQFKGKTCVYCATEGSSQTGDHVFAREFFDISDRQNLPKVPACKRCNGEKSTLEHYLTAVLPFGGRHSDASSNLKSMTPKRLAKNLRLHGDLARGSTKIWTRETSGIYVRTTAIPFDWSRLEGLLTFIVKGLMWHHWEVQLETNCFINVLSLTQHGEQVFTKYASMRAKERVEESIGNGAFNYKGAQGMDNPQVSVWEFSIYGGLKLTGRGSDEESIKIGAVSGPNRIKASAKRKTLARRRVLPF
ncbi:MAG: HNH endonuclease [Alphaproteobacteria bacterium]